jgi:hypothetical protein
MNMKRRKCYATKKECVVVSHTFDAQTDVYTDDENIDTLLPDLYNEYLQEEIDNNSDLDMNECCIVEDEGFAQIAWEDGDKTFFVRTVIMDCEAI